MSWLLTIDPGKRSLAWALLLNSELIGCSLTKSKHDPWERYLDLLVMSIHLDVQQIRAPYALASNETLSPYQVVVELPRVYPHERHVRPNDLIDLAAAAGACATLPGPFKFVHPHQWKGQLSKKMSNARTINALSPDEMEILGRWQKNHNVLDAIGIGLKEVGRT